MDTKHILTEAEVKDQLSRLRYLGQVLIVPDDTKVPTDDNTDEWGDQDHEIIVIR